MFKTFVSLYKQWFPAEEVHAHCDGPCGVYDPAQARVTAEAVVSMTKKLLALELPQDHEARLAYNNTFARYVAIKEEQAHETKTHLLVLWTDYFKPQHLADYPDLHDKIWQATKLCSACKVEINQEKADQLLAAVKEVHEIFWATKGREVPWITAS